MPSIEAGRLDDLRRDGAREAAQKMVSEIDAVAILLEYRHVLTGRPRRVFDLYYNEARTLVEIARHLGIHRHTAARALEQAHLLLLNAARRNQS